MAALRRSLVLLVVLASQARAQVDVAVDVAEVAFGAPFSFAADVPPAFDDAAFLPVEVERLDERALDDGRVRRRYRARCYRVGAVTFPDDANSTLVVASSLPEPPGELEWPSDGFAPASGWRSWPWVLGAAVVVVVLGGAAFARRRRPQLAPAADACASYDADAALRALALPDSPADATRYYGQLKAVVRRHCAARFAIPADVRTSEELLALLRDGRDELRPCLQLCDLALFGGAPGDAERHQLARDHARRFVARGEVAS